MQKLFITLILLIMIQCAFAVVTTEFMGPISTPQNGITPLELKITQGFEEIQQVNVYFREIETNEYRFETMTAGSAANPIFAYALPVLTPNAKGYEYYFEITKTDNTQETLPANQPNINPYRVMQEAPRVTESGYVILSPQGDTIEGGDELILAISTYAIADDLDLASIRISLNGKDVTNAAVITDNMIVYRQSKPKAGSASFQISAYTKDGKEIPSPALNFTVKPGNKLVNLPLNMRGNATFISNVIQTSKDSNAYAVGSSLDDASFNLNLYGGKDWFDFRTRLYLTTLDGEYTQPLDRYTIGLSVPHFETVLGDYAPYYANYTVNSKNVRGIYARISMKGMEITGTFGQTAKMVKGKPIDTIPTTYGPGTFQRDMMAARFLFGSTKTFSWAFDFVKSKDIISSLDSLYYKSASQDSVFVQPVDNIVAGTDLKFNLLHQRLIIGLEAAGSIFNSNTYGGSIDKETLNDYVGDLNYDVNPQDFEDIFIINKNIQPFDISAGNLAYQGYLRTYFLNNFLNVSYSAVGASFKSLASNAATNDTRTINVSDNINLMNHVFLDAGVNIMSDNLSKQKLETNTYTTIYGQMLMRFANLPYVRIGMNTNSGANKENTDIQSTGSFTKMKTAAQSMDLGMGYNFVQVPIAPTKLDITYTLGSDQDKENATYDLKRNNMNIVLTSVFQQMPLTTKIMFNTASNTNEYGVAKTKNSNTDFGLRGEYKLYEEKLIPFADFRITSLGGDQVAQSYSFLNLGARYMPFEQTTISSNIGYKTYGTDDPDANYSTFSWNLTLSQKF